MKGTTCFGTRKLERVRDIPSVRPSLLLEGALEGVEEVSQAEGADGAGRDGILGSGEDGVNEAVVLPAILAGDDLARRLCGRRGGNTHERFCLSKY